MTTALLYRPQQRSGIWIALAASALIHCAAVAIAQMQHSPPLLDVGTNEPGDDPIELEDSPIPETVEPPAPPESPVSLSPEDNSFPLDSVPAPTTRKPNERIKSPRPPYTPARQQSRGGSVSAKLLALTAPRPEYPYEARRAKITGQGVVVLTVDPVSGNVTAAAMAESTGSAVLDQAALAAFRRWRFRSGTPASVRCPI